MYQDAQIQAPSYVSLLPVDTSLPLLHISLGCQALNQGR